jgi:hypothetical protein
MAPEFEWDAKKAEENLKKHGVRFEEGPERHQRANAGTMSKTARRNPRPESTAMRAEYEFDYSRAKPNRFAAHMDRPVVAVLLEPDVASVFKSFAKVNAQLRSIIAARAGRRSSSRVRSHRRKAG